MSSIRHQPSLGSLQSHVERPAGARQAFDHRPGPHRMERRVDQGTMYRPCGTRRRSAEPPHLGPTCGVDRCNGPCIDSIPDQPPLVAHAVALPTRWLLKHVLRRSAATGLAWPVFRRPQLQLQYVCGYFTLCTRYRTHSIPRLSGPRQLNQTCGSATSETAAGVMEDSGEFWLEP